MKIDPCSLLSSAEIQAVQGEPVKQTVPSERASGDFVTRTCYYSLATAANSISLSVTLRDPDKQRGQSIKEFWETSFANSKAKASDRDKDNAQSDNGVRRDEEEDEGSANAEPVRGLGSEAFWTASRVGGVLYILDRDRFIRISVGGQGDAESKLRKSKTLGEKALRRL